jgi:antitoxin CcdA
MRKANESRAPKKAANLSINSDLLAEARQLKINLSATLEKALEAELRAVRAAQWLADNRTRLAACNELAEKDGLFADQHRVF